MTALRRSLARDTYPGRNIMPLDRIRLKFRAHVEMGQSPPSSTYSRSPEDGLPFLQGCADFGETTPNPKVYSTDPTKMALPDDILLSVRAPVGELNVADRTFGIGRGLCAIRPGKDLRRFVWWTLHEAKHQLHHISTGSTYEAVATEDVENLLIVQAPTNQQRTIADYLDRETERLDALIAEKERLLKLLAEKRRALITRAVTRGLDPDAPMRDSGVSWLGRIPGRWGIWKLGHTASIGNGSTPNRNKAAYWTDGRIPWLNSSVVNQSEVTGADQFVTAFAVQECHLPLVKAGSVLIAITGQGKTRGRAVVLSIDSTINQHLAFIQPESFRLRPWFLRWILFAAYDFLRNISDDTGGTKGALTCEQVANLRVPIPPPGEQAAILDHIGVSAGRLDYLRSAAEKTIAIIKERRAALITAAVTGQIDVGGVG